MVPDSVVTSVQTIRCPSWAREVDELGAGLGAFDSLAELAGAVRSSDSLEELAGVARSSDSLAVCARLGSAMKIEQSVRALANPTRRARGLRFRLG